jgi:threonyl-tRNA synthetase
LIENHAGALPLWLAPRQIAVTAITSEQNPYVETVVNQLKAAGLRAEVDLRPDKISYKIRELSLQKLPYIAVVGAKEAEQGAVAVRGRGNVDLGVMPIEKFIELVVRQNRPGAHLN